jgi:hypothetical protein
LDWISKVRKKEREFWALERRDYRVEAILANALVKAETQLRRQNKWILVKTKRPKANNSSTCSDNQPAQLGEETRGVINSTDTLVWLGDNQPAQLGEETSGVINSTDTLVCLDTERNSADSSVVSMKSYFSRQLIKFLTRAIRRLKRIYHLDFNWHS